MGRTDDDKWDEPFSPHDIGHLGADERSELATLLDRYDVCHHHVGTELQAAAAEAELVQDLIAHVTIPIADRPPAPSSTGRIGLQPESRLTGSLAPRWRRLIAFLVEAYILGGIAWGAGLMQPQYGATVVGVALSMASGLVMVAITGQTVGMWMFRMRVVVAPTTDPPGWGTAAIRFLVATGPGLVLVMIGPIVPAHLRWLGIADTIWLLACFGPILFDHRRRGLHDRAARTFVVEAGAVGPLD